MNILLIRPGVIRKQDYPPLGLFSIGTVLKKRGYIEKGLIDYKKAAANTLK